MVSYTCGRAADTGPAYCAAIIRVPSITECALPYAKVMSRCVSVGYERKVVSLARTYVYSVLRVWYESSEINDMLFVWPRLHMTPLFSVCLYCHSGRVQS